MSMYSNQPQGRSVGRTIRASLAAIALVFMSTTVAFAQSPQLASHVDRIATSDTPLLTRYEQNAEKLSRKISIRFNRTSLQEALSLIARKAGLKLSINHGLIDSAQPVTLTLQNVTVLQALERTIEGTGFSLKLSPTGYLMVVPKVGNAAEALVATHEEAPAFTVTGVVTAANDREPLPGVNVLVKGTGAGTATDLDGRYTIEAGSPNDTLLFSYVGFRVQEVAISGRNTVNVSLEEDLGELDEVVVIGYGEKSRKMMTESIGTVSTDDIQKLPVMSADQALQGRVSGVQITNVTGLPGTPVSVRIRGVGTVGNAQPLFVIDGVPIGKNDNSTVNPLSLINPADIQSISVLKDASAAAVYGMQAANGVVLITTKKGAVEGGQGESKPVITLDSYYGVQQFPQLWDMLSTTELVGLIERANLAYNTQKNLKPGDSDYRIMPTDLLPGSKYLNIDNSEEWISDAANENAGMQNHNLSVTGATRQLNYFISAGYSGQEAIIQHWDVDRYTFRANSDYQVAPWLKVGQTFTLSHQYLDRGMEGGGDGFLLRNAATMPPFFNIYDTEGTVPNNRYGYAGNIGVAGNTRGNQNGINMVRWTHTYDTRVIGSLGAEIDLPVGFAYETRASLDYSINQSGSWQPPWTAAELGYDRTQENYVSQTGTSNSQTFWNALRFENRFSGHRFNLLAGNEIRTGSYQGEQLYGAGFVSLDPNFFKVINNAQTREIQGAWAGEYGGLGWIGRMSYDYLERYLLTASVRRDGSYRFAPGQRWGTFPSVSGAWRVSQEPFFKVPFVSEFKIRGSWGQLGNDETAAYPYMLRVSSTPDYGLNGENVVKAPSPNNFVNENVTWETVETTDFGVDVSMFNNKLDFLATYYNRSTKNFLIDVPLPHITGFTTTQINVGNVVNRGLEFELNYAISPIKDLTLNFNGNLTTVNNELTELIDGVDQFTEGSGYRTSVGHPIGYFYGYKTDGLYRTAEELAAAPVDKTIAGDVKPQLGDVRFVDVNYTCTDADYKNETCQAGQAFIEGKQDGLIDANDRTYLGKTIPDFYYGLTFDAYYKNFDLSVLFNGVGGVQIYNAFRQGTMGVGAGGNSLRDVLDAWTPENSDTDVPRLVASDPNGNGRFSDRWIEEGSYFRLRNVQLGYTLPQSFTRNRINRMRIYMTVSNLLTMTPYRGLDPELVTYGQNQSQLRARTDEGVVPQPRTYQFGVQLTF